MELGVAALRWADTKGLERLARALRLTPVRLRDPGDYHETLAEDVAKAIADDRRRAAAEERRAMELATAKKVAAEIADALGEHGAEGQAPRARVEAQLARMILMMGIEWVHEVLRQTLELVRGRALKDADLLFRRDEKARMPGAVFFALARRRGRAALSTVDGVPRTFYGAFCWREPQPRALKPTPSVPPQNRPKPPATRPQAPRPARAVRTHDRRAPAQMPEVYQARRAPR